jgi:hypothetical protein
VNITAVAVIDAIVEKKKKQWGNLYQLHNL